MPLWCTSRPLRPVSAIRLWVSCRCLLRQETHAGFEVEQQARRVVSVEIPIAGASQVEDETTIEYMRRYGCQNVRGGKYVRVIDDDATWWLPVEFQPGQINAYGLYPASRCTAVAETPSVPSPAGAPLLCPDPLV